MNKFLVLSLVTLYFSYLVVADPVAKYIIRRQIANTNFSGGATATGSGVAGGNATGNSATGNATGALQVTSTGNASSASYDYATNGTSGSTQGQGTAGNGEGQGTGTGSAAGNNASVIINTSGNSTGSGGHSGGASLNQSRVLVGSSAIPATNNNVPARQGKLYYYPYVYGGYRAYPNFYSSWGKR